jgi:hypothetical protein
MPTLLAKKAEKVSKVSISITLKMVSKSCHCNNPAPGQFREEGDCDCGLENQHTHCETCGGVWKE